MYSEWWDLIKNIKPLPTPITWLCFDFLEHGLVPFPFPAYGMSSAHIHM
jgi:hypothetical protein